MASMATGSDTSSRLRARDAEATDDDGLAFLREIVEEKKRVSGEGEPQAMAGGEGGWTRKKIIALAAAAGAAALVLLGIILVVRDRSGKKVLRYQVPNGGRVTMTDDAQAGAP